MGNKPRKSVVEPAYLESLPPELLSDVVDYLPSFSVYRLYLCGSKPLQKVLTSERAVKSLIFDVPAYTNSKWPCFPSYFAHLKRYTFKVMNSSTEYSIRNFDIKVLPSSLVKLELKGQRMRSLFFDLKSQRGQDHPFLQQYQDLNAVLPLLEVFKVSTSGLIGPSFFSSLPRGLLVLVAYAWHIPVSHRILSLLPPNLTELDLHQSNREYKTQVSSEVNNHLYIYRQDDVLDDVIFPKGLEKLACALPWIYGVVPFLPSSVTSVDISEETQSLLSACKLGGPLPPNVTMFSIRGRLDPNSVKFLPKTLTQLSINGRCDIDWSSSPFPFLTSLPNSAAHQQWTLSMVQALPLCLTTWSAPHPHLHAWTPDEFKEVIEALPHNVRCLNIFAWTLTAEIISVLPPNLNELWFESFKGSLEQLSQLLPPSISKIKCGQTSIADCRELLGSPLARWNWHARAVEQEDSASLTRLYPNLNPKILTRFRFEKMFLFRPSGLFAKKFRVQNF